MDDNSNFHNESLPSEEKFYNQLNNKHITNEEYEHAKEVWKAFDLKDMGEYHDLYLVGDVLLLTDVFENFRTHCLNYYKLDTCHYFTSPGLSWGAMLRMTGIRLELMTDIDMYQFIEKAFMVEFHTLLTDMEKLTTSTLIITMRRRPLSLSCILMQTISMVGQ